MRPALKFDTPRGLVLSMSPGGGVRSFLEEVEPGYCIGPVEIGGARFHLEAIEVKHQEQPCVLEAVSESWQEKLAELHHAHGADGPFNALVINGRSWALFLSPYC